MRGAIIRCDGAGCGATLDVTGADLNAFAPAQLRWGVLVVQDDPTKFAQRLDVCPWHARYGRTTPRGTQAPVADVLEHLTGILGAYAGGHGMDNEGAVIDAFVVALCELPEEQRDVLHAQATCRRYVDPVAGGNGGAP